jgi:hypothetical protein
VLIAVAWFWGSRLNATLEPPMLVNAPPLTGSFHAELQFWFALPLLAAVIGVSWLPRLAEELAWRRLLLISVLLSALWLLALASSVGPSLVARPLGNPLDTFADLHQVGSVSGFLASFVERIVGFTSHTRSHPPGMLMLFWAMKQVGMGGTGWAAALEITGGALAPPAIMLALREVSDERTARAAFPFLILTPTAIWMSTTADALFAGVAAWAVACIVLATGSRGRRSLWLALAGGTLFAWALFLSYGLVLVGLIPFGVAVTRRRWQPLLVAAVPLALITLAFAAAGFWWLDGLQATREQYLLGVSRYRPGSYFLLADLAALAVCLGPATAVGLARLRGRGPWLLVGGALAGVAIADVSGMSKGEVERIWLPFAVWLLVACAPLGRSSRLRAWLAAQGGFALMIQLVVRN